MSRTFSLALLLLVGGCDGYSREYSKAVQNQMIAADDGQNQAIAELQSQVAELKTQQSGDALLQQNEILALGNVVAANRRLADAQHNDLETTTQRK